MHFAMFATVVPRWAASLYVVTIPLASSSSQGKPKMAQISTEPASVALWPGMEPQACTPT